MTVKRVILIAAVFVLAGAGWFLLGLATQRRTEQAGRSIDARVEALWGLPLVQRAPSFSVRIPGGDRERWIMPVTNQVNVALHADYRKKGLLWYSTYIAAFDGAYTIRNEDKVAQKVRIHFDFPAKEGTYDAFSAWVNGVRPAQDIRTDEGINEMIELPPGEEAVFQVAYRTRGLGSWQYALDPNAGRVQGLELEVQTDFTNVDYTDGSLSPMAVEAGEQGGLRLAWEASDLITRQNIGVVIPDRLNPGPLTSRITFFAPVCLVFFFVLVVTINVLYRVDIHPMHYLFVAAGFFAFHLLFAYLVDVINIHLAFILSALVSVSLVTTYLSAALRGRFPWKVAIAGQLFYLVLFSYSFFLKGVTGLTIAIGSVVTLAVLMRVTAHIDWNEVFVVKAKEKKVPALATPATEDTAESQS